jgi:hypothetical protein
MSVTLTHVLAWVPGYLAVPPRAVGWWDLVTLAEYKSGNFPDRNPDSADWPRDADPCLLHHWVADRLGCWRVTLEEGSARIWRPWPPRLPTREPVYYVHTEVSS